MHVFLSDEILFFFRTQVCSEWLCAKLVLYGNFDNNRECCMAKKSGYLVYGSLPGKIHSGCIKTPKLGLQFCEEHLQDHQELDRDAIDLQNEVPEEVSQCFGPCLRSSKKNPNAKLWGQVEKI